MARVILSEEQKRWNAVKDLYVKQQERTFDFNINDFVIDTDFSFKHKSWNTWIIGGSSKEETYEIINRYIDECNKPFISRNLNFIHLKQA